MDDDSRLKAELEPLETALLSAARNESAARIKDAGAHATAMVNEGQARAKSVLEHAAAEGARAAERAAARRLVEAKRRARACVLAAQRAAYDQLLTDAAAGAATLRDQPDYADLERRLADAARAALGANAQVVRDPDGRGGVRASEGSRTVDLTLASLSRQCIDQMGERVTALWA